MQRPCQKRENDDSDNNDNDENGDYYNNENDENDDYVNNENDENDDSNNNISLIADLAHRESGLHRPCQKNASIVPAFSLPWTTHIWYIYQDVFSLIMASDGRSHIPNFVYI